MSAYSHSGSVYFAACGDFVKIGFTSTNVAHRLVALRGGKGVRCPEALDQTAPIRLVRQIRNCVMRDERRIHGLFAAHHVEGEWFRYDAAFIEHLMGLEYVTYAETLLRFRHARAELKRRPSLARVA